MYNLAFCLLGAKLCKRQRVMHGVKHSRPTWDVCALQEFNAVLLTSRGEAFTGRHKMFVKDSCALYELLDDGAELQEASQSERNTTYTAFKNLKIKPCIMAEYVGPRSSSAFCDQCRKENMRYVKRNGAGITQAGHQFVSFGKPQLSVW